MSDCLAPQKKPYNAPVLKDFGDVRDVTLGGSAGNLESGFPNTFFSGLGPSAPRRPRGGGQGSS